MSEKTFAALAVLAIIAVVIVAGIAGSNGARCVERESRIVMQYDVALKMMMPRRVSRCVRWEKVEEVEKKGLDDE